MPLVRGQAIDVLGGMNARQLIASRGLRVADGSPLRTSRFADEIKHRRALGSFGVTRRGDVFVKPGTAYDHRIVELAERASILRGKTGSCLSHHLVKRVTMFE